MESTRIGHPHRALQACRGEAISYHLNVGVDAGVLNRLFSSNPAQPEDGELCLGDAETLGLR